MEHREIGHNPIVKNKFLRFFLFICGFLTGFLAMVGIVLPLVPTTPFLIVSAACFYKSSPRFYGLIMNNRYVGHYLNDYKSGKGVPLRVKLVSIGFMWISAIISLIFFVPFLWLKLLIAFIVAGVTVHICRIKTKRAG